MGHYSTRQLAVILGVRPARIRALAHTASITSTRNKQGHLLFSFQDLVRLRLTQTLLHQCHNSRRVRRVMRLVQQQLGHADRSLASIRVQLEGSNLLVRADNVTWAPESGQTVFDFTPPQEARLYICARFCR